MELQAGDEVGLTFIRQAARWLIKGVFALLLVILAASLVPSDEAYYRIERALSHIGPLGSASQHLRSVPATTASLIYEMTQSRSLLVEGVSINLNFAVNASERVEAGSLTSAILGQERSYSIYLPPGYDASSELYPTLYLLHGMGQGPSWWTEVARVDRIATSMIESGKIRPLIIVMPNGNHSERDITTTSLYDNRCETGLDLVARALKSLGDHFSGLSLYNVSCASDFADYIVNEVVAEIDARHRTSGERYIGGFSIGGRGAMQLALEYEDVFKGAFGLSGNYDFIRKQLRNGGIVPNGSKLFLASGDKDQRGVYGALNTFLFHKELDGMGVAHLYCTYEGTHSDLAWVNALPAALQHLLPSNTATGAEAFRSCSS